MGVNYTNYDGAGNQAQQTDQINTAISNGANLLIVNIVETSSPDSAQQACDAAKNAGIPIIFFNREVDDAVVSSYENCAFVGTDAPCMWPDLKENGKKDNTGRAGGDCK